MCGSDRVPDDCFVFASVNTAMRTSHLTLHSGQQECNLRTEISVWFWQVHELITCWLRSGFFSVLGCHCRLKSRHTGVLGQLWSKVKKHKVAIAATLAIVALIAGTKLSLGKDGEGTLMWQDQGLLHGWLPCTLRRAAALLFLLPGTNRLLRKVSREHNSRSACILGCLVTELRSAPR